VIAFLAEPFGKPGAFDGETAQEAGRNGLARITAGEDWPEGDQDPANARLRRQAPDGLADGFAPPMDRRSDLRRRLRRDRSWAAHGVFFCDKCESRSHARSLDGRVAFWHRLHQCIFDRRCRLGLIANWAESCRTCFLLSRSARVDSSSRSWCWRSSCRRSSALSAK
jgi:hypothetical protein